MLSTCDVNEESNKLLAKCIIDYYIKHQHPGRKKPAPRKYTPMQILKPRRERRAMWRKFLHQARNMVGVCNVRQVKMTYPWFRSGLTSKNTNIRPGAYRD